MQKQYERHIHLVIRNRLTASKISRWFKRCYDPIPPDRPNESPNWALKKFLDVCSDTAENTTSVLSTIKNDKLDSYRCFPTVCSMPDSFGAISITLFVWVIHSTDHESDKDYFND